MEMTDLAPKETWAQLEKDLNEKFNMNCMVYNAQGAGITGSPTWGNELCPKVKGNPDSLAQVCAVANNAFTQQVKKTREPMVAECDMGMVKIVVPVFVKDEFVGMAGGCGTIAPGMEVETFIMMKTAGMTEEELEKLAATVPEMTEEQATEFVDYLQKRIDEIVAAAA